MKITLRKANAIQTSIQDAIKGIEVESTAQLNEFQDIAAELLKVNAAAVKEVKRQEALLFALYNIRGLVGTANSTAGIDLQLTDAAFIDKRIAQMSAIASAKPMTDITVLKGQLEKIRAAAGNNQRSMYGHADTVSTSVYTQEQIDQAKQEMLKLKKQKQSINDKVLELNIKTEITLPDQVVSTLAAESLI